MHGIGFLPGADAMGRGFPLFWRAESKKIAGKSMEHLIDLFQSPEDDKNKSKKLKFSYLPQLLSFFNLGREGTGSRLPGKLAIVLELARNQPSDSEAGGVQKGANNDAEKYSQSL